MTDSPSGARRLWRALLSGEHAHDHADCQEALPEFIEAEMAGEDAARLHPGVQAHLDSCEACDALHAGMLDALMAEAAGAIPEPAQLPPLRLPRPVRQRQWARQVAGAVLAALGKWQGDLDLAAQSFFDALARAPGRLELAPASAEFGLGSLDSEALPLVMAAYYALVDLAEGHSAAELRALADAGGLRPLLERAAHDEAHRMGLRGVPARTFAASFVALALGDVPQLLDLLSAPADSPSD